MKVLIISPCTLPVPAVKGGAVLTLIESLIAKNEMREEMELSIVGSYDEASVEKSSDYPNTKFIFIRMPDIVKLADCGIDGILGKIRNDGKNHQYLWKLYVLAKIKKILLKNHYDRIVFQNSGYLIAVLINTKIARRYKGKMYYHLHNDIPDSVYIKGAKQCELLLISNYLSRKVNRLCGDDMIRHTRVVKNGFKTQLFAKSLDESERESLKKSLGIKIDKKIITYAGRITPYKGIKELVDAYNRLNRTDTVLMIIGSHNFGSGQTSKFEQEIKKYIDQLKGTVIFTGYIPYGDMWKYYQVADVAVLPSMWEEPAGLTMIEAAAASVPVITTESGGIPEYLNDRLAIFVKRDEQIVDHLEEAIKEVLDNPEKWGKIANKSSQYVQEHFTEDIFYENFVKALNGG